MEPVKDLEDGGDMVVFTPPRQDPGSASAFRFTAPVSLSPPILLMQRCSYTVAQTPVLGGHPEPPSTDSPWPTPGGASVSQGKAKTLQGPLKNPPEALCNPTFCTETSGC